ncbi:MAG: hypothetical protein ACR2H3_05260 [Acidimicrobiales bacterium]
MVVSWLMKVVIGLAVLGVLVVDLGSPLVMRAQADDAAHEVANEAALVIGPALRDTKGMKERCEEVALAKSVSVIDCSVTLGKVHVTVEKEAISLVLHRLPPLKSWYTAQVSATADPK